MSKALRNREISSNQIVREISQKSGVNVDHKKNIQVLKDATDVGNGTWSKIDYLVKNDGYNQIFVGKFN